MDESERIVEIEIFGQVYPVRAKVTSEEYVREIAGYVDRKMREIDETMHPSSITRLAILAALNVADELFTLRENLDRSITEYNQRLRRSKEALESGLREG